MAYQIICLGERSMVFLREIWILLLLGRLFLFYRYMLDVAGLVVTIITQTYNGWVSKPLFINITDLTLVSDYVWVITY